MAMKCLGKLSLGLLFFGNLFFGALFSKTLILGSSDEGPYITIFEKVTPLGDANFNLIRLYKISTPTKFRRALPTSFTYNELVKKELSDLREEELLRPGAQIAHGRVIIDKNNKEFFYKMFSDVVDNYVLVNPGSACTSHKDEYPAVWNVPGEIIYFNEAHIPCEVEVGCFQYVIDADGSCLSRTFVRHSRIRVVTDHHGITRVFSTNYHYFDKLAVGKLIDDYLEQQHDAIFSNPWLHEIQSLLTRYERTTGEAFI